jgi:Na+-translocating ferredoxin:NAD+ oxidoreductase subunit G
MASAEGKPEGNPLATLLIVGAVAAAAAFIVSASHEFSKDRIAANERARLIASLSSVLDPELRNHDLATTRLTVGDEALLGGAAVDVFVASEHGVPVATIFASVAPNGYNASIRLLIGVTPDGSVSGVRVVSHRETPGLGDKIDTAKSNWITQFYRKTLQMPALPGWAVDKDEGGEFDTLTGATVTSRAVVYAVKNTLLYFDAHRDELFMTAAAQADDTPDDAAPAR